MFLPLANLAHIDAVTHEGKLVVVATDSGARLWYTVKQDGFEDSALTGSTTLAGWEDWKELPLPPAQPTGDRTPEADDDSVIQRELKELTVDGPSLQPILRSRYRTADDSAVAPVKLVSGLGHLYVFRQSSPTASEVSPNTLLVDRFVLDGINNNLVRKLEVRFKRSRQRYQPLKPSEGSKAKLIDSLDFTDANSKPFFEPTTELSLVGELRDGWFSVVLMPTQEQDESRWHIFAFNSKTNRVELTTLRASAEGLFDVQDNTVFEVEAGGGDRIVPRSVGGVVRRALELSDAAGKALTPANGLTATKYDIQVERETESGPRLLRDKTRVLLAVPTDDGQTAAVSFAVARDGMLAETSGRTSSISVLRDRSRELLLPVDTLDEIRTIGSGEPPAQGLITGLRGESGNRTRVLSEAAGALNTGDVIRIDGTSPVDGKYTAVRRNENTFLIDADQLDGVGDLGHWTVVPNEETGHVFDDMITRYRMTSDGKLLVTVPGHGLETGDAVQIVDTAGIDGLFSVTKRNGSSFLIEQPWAPGEAVDLKLVARRRRGTQFDGVEDEIITPPIPLIAPVSTTSFGYTMSAWVWLPETDRSTTGSRAVVAAQLNGLVSIAIVGGAALASVTVGGDVKDLTDGVVIPQKTWTHLAATVGYDSTNRTVTVLLCRDGVEVGKSTPIPLPTKTGGQEESEEEVFADWSPEFTIGRQLIGRVAEVRIWDHARSVDAIRDAMHLRLTGREVGLAGYWRLGGLTEGKAVDFSVNGNDGVVHGNPYLSARMLSRKLEDGETDAVKYVNDELIAVTQRATYIEEFEFRIHGTSQGQWIEPNDVDGRGTPAFVASVWGQRNRSADERREVASQATPFTALTDGWYRSTARFTVPDDVSMVRSFGLSTVGGAWKELEVRRHRVRLISDAITEIRHDEKLQLTTLVDQHQPLTANLVDLEEKEAEEGLLLIEKRQVELKLAAYADLPALRAKVAALRAEVDNLTVEEQQRGAVHKYEQQNPLNYWCKIDNGMNPENGYGKDSFLNRAHPKNVHVEVGNANYRQWWKFEPTGTGSYLIKNGLSPENGYGPDCYLMVIGDNVEVGAQAEGFNWLTQKWTLEPYGTYFYVKNVFKSKYLSRDHPTNVIVSGKILRNLRFRWTLERTGRVAHPAVIDNARRAWTVKRHELALKQTELDASSAVLEANAGESNLWEKRLAEIHRLLAPIQAELARLNTEFVDAVRSIQQTPQVMPEVAVDQRGLIVQGALLGFVRPGGRLNSIETSEGTVVLSYSSDGRMRQAVFDATADSANTGSEQWRPESLRACASFDKPASKMLLVQDQDQDQDQGTDVRETIETPVQLGATWTVEAWFSWPLPDTDQWNVLACGSDGESPALVRNGTTLGTQLKTDGAFHACEHDLTTLAAGWHHLAVVGSGTDEEPRTTYYLDGGEVGQIDVRCAGEISAIGNSKSGDGCQFGKLAEFRLWSVALTAAEVAVNAMTVLSGNEPGLVAYHPMDEATGSLVRDHVDYDVSGSTRLKGYDGSTTAVTWSGWSAPVGRPPGANAIGDAVMMAEYSTIGVDASDVRRKTALLRRFIASPSPSEAGVALFPDKRLEEVDLVWIGNAQFEPTLLGYIEGAPPVPSENLTVDGSLNYNGATSVSLSVSDDVTYSWSREQEAGVGAKLDLFVGVEEDINLGFILTKKAFSTKIGFVGDLDVSYGFQNRSTVSSTSGTNTQDRLELRGAPEPGTKFPHIGRRFVPKNVGYALVTSGLADVFVTKLRRSGRMLSYQVLPNTDVPVDVNTITFLINPAYTMNGSLDGQTGSSATSDRFFRHVPEMRAQFGSRYPASYYRLQEAYDLKQQIDNADKRRESYFSNFNSRLIDEASLGREIEKTGFDSPEVSVDPDGGDGSGDEETDAKKLERIEDILGQDEDEVEREGEARQSAIEAKIADQERRVHATASYASWQRQMEDLQIRAGKRNIVNNYVWDGDGGWRAEAQQFADTVEHTVGASLDLSGSLGWTTGVSFFAAGLELTAAATVKLTQTMTKTESRSRGFGLDVDLSGVEHVGITDFNDHPLVPGEKVDRYRFMSFYLEASSKNHHDFFDHVVDPEWLASNDEEARALRQARSGTAGKAWRVLHRVTYVERPALMDFGGDVRSRGNIEERPWWFPSVGGVLKNVEELQVRSDELEAKLDQIVRLLKKKPGES